ncbi:hypothetical protein [Effusibacillus dendaii]|uniref:Uncharacterized protein n=1 Tax=Effusibacillus dendaii TaxID=2743772 RepID=A0A7I8DI32_9BACL|nr:hypothetical protein [Effusibacillus dendaii]BCJ88586.1 hypothetical protein skT53_35710 [Effusibacillus dendaii]
MFAKRKFWLVGLCTLVATVVVWAAAGGQASRFWKMGSGTADTDPVRKSAAISFLQKELQVNDATNIIIGEWQKLPPQNRAPSAAEIKQELSSIEQQIETIAAQKAQANAIREDRQSSIQAVENDFSNGRLTADDAAMLRSMFQQKVDKQVQEYNRLDERQKQLETRKQQLISIQNGEALQYAEAEIEKGLMAYRTTTVFYDPKRQHILTAEEVRDHPAASEWKANHPDRTANRISRNVIVAGSGSILLIGGTALLSVLYRRRQTLKVLHPHT